MPILDDCRLTAGALVGAMRSQKPWLKNTC